MHFITIVHQILMFEINAKMLILNFVLVILYLDSGINGEQVDLPCARQQVKGKSVICVCNSTYCDTITRVPPSAGEYVTYTSSKGGLRFLKERNKLLVSPLNHNFDNSSCSATLVLDPETRYQTIEGFGGAVTDAAAMNWKNLTEPLQEFLINSYFGTEGLQYNTLRVPIGGTDFSTHGYAYNDLPANDNKLSNFTLAPEDYQYKIPMIKAAMRKATVPIHIVASTWSPPVWMKSNPVYSGMGHLKPEYYQTYADYHYKFIEKYNTEGVPIWAITTTNEPTNGELGLCFGINCLGWTANNLGRWIVNNLGPTMRNSSYSYVKILVGDDQRLNLLYWTKVMLYENPDALKYIDGIAVHYYTDFIAPAAILTELTKSYPDKFIINTEACTGTFWLEKHHVDLGSWQRAQIYIQDIIIDLNHNVVGWLDWNMCLNAEGGPTYVRNFADSPIIVFPEQQSFVKQPMFYAMGHFAKFIPRGSRRIGVKEMCGCCGSMSHVAFVTPSNTIVVVIYNNGKARSVNIRLGGKQAEVNVEAYAVTTVEFNNTT